MRLGADDYHEGAMRSLRDAQALSDQRRWVGAVYLAGRAVEAILRSLLWLKTRQHEIGHDLKSLLKRARSVGMLAEADEELDDDVAEIGVIWHNNLRFVGERKFLDDLKGLGRGKGGRIRTRKVRGDPVKANARSILQASEAVVARGALVWRHYKKSLQR